MVLQLVGSELPVGFSYSSWAKAIEELQFKAELKLIFEEAAQRCCPSVSKRLGTISVANQLANVGFKKHFTEICISPEVYPSGLCCPDMPDPAMEKSVLFPFWNNVVYFSSVFPEMKIHQCATVKLQNPVICLFPDPCVQVLLMFVPFLFC